MLRGARYGYLQNMLALIFLVIKFFFEGDDTWESLYPRGFQKSLPLPSFDVWDLDTVDSQVKKWDTDT
jgi:hypothetical protein